MNQQRVLTEEQVKSFHDEGFLVVKGMYSAEETEQISQWTDDVAAYPEVPGKYMMYFEEGAQGQGRILSRIENFVPYHQGFNTLITARRMQQAVCELFGQDAVLFKDKINFKLPGGDGFKEHQDVQAGWDTYSPLHITAMIAIDETNEENGSLEMLPAMHKKGLLGEMWAPLTDDDTEGRNYIPVHCQPGDAVFFDSYAPHRSGPNLSSDRRRVLYITYNTLESGDHRAQYYADKRESYPPDVERDENREYSFRV